MKHVAIFVNKLIVVISMQTCLSNLTQETCNSIYFQRQFKSIVDKYIAEAVVF